MGRKIPLEKLTNAKDAREARLKAALKVNLQRRKAQTRARNELETEDAATETGRANNDKAG
jgi:hypothetical protein